MSSGALTAHLSDNSAADYADTTVTASGQYNRNYTLTYRALSPGQTLKITWTMAPGNGNLTLNGAAWQSARKGRTSRKPDNPRGRTIQYAMRGLAAVSILAVLLVLSPLQTGESAHEIVLRSICKNLSNWSLRKNYTYLIRDQEKELDQRGVAMRTKSDVVEVSILYGEPYFRLMEKDGKPLSANDDRREQEKLARFTAKRKDDTEEQKARRLADFEKKRAKDREFLWEVPEAYDLQLLGDAMVDGKNSYVVGAEPRPEYRPKTEMGKYLPKIRGKIWIDKAEYQWVKVEAETTGMIAFGFFLFRLDKGAHLEFEQARVNDEIWMPKRIHAAAAGRVGLVIKGAYESDTIFENYRKFQSDSRIVSSSEVK